MKAAGKGQTAAFLQEYKMLNSVFEKKTLLKSKEFNENTIFPNFPHISQKNVSTNKKNCLKSKWNVF